MCSSECWHAPRPKASSQIQGNIIWEKIFPTNTDPFPKEKMS